jgi:CubicO group peptidase (beta-lactamase class C family)
MRLRQTILIFLVLSACSAIGCQPYARKAAEEKLSSIDAVVEEEITNGSFPGAVVLVGQPRPCRRGEGQADKILYWWAFGHAVAQPYREAMTKNTIFDVASLTKPIATATSIMILADRKKIELTDYVGKYIPDFACNSKEQVRIDHLLTHTSGLPAYTDANELKEQFGSLCPDKVIERICRMKALSKPGEEFRYSCLGYIILAKILEAASGQDFADFAAENIFEPLKMTRTIFNPPESWTNDIAATQLLEQRLLRGTVHDPLARLMGGVSGNAGLFSTAYDLSLYCRMLANNGTLDGARVLSPDAVAMLTIAQSHGRAYGFDVSSSYSWVKGSFAPEQAFCHTGYTGTSIVCDPVNKVYVIILSNSIHPHDKGTSKAIRVKVVDIVFGTGGSPGNHQTDKSPMD